MKKNSFLILFILCFSMLFTSCDKDSSKIEHQDKVTYLIQEYGFNGDHIEVTENEIIVEKDIAFKTEDFWKNYRINEVENEDKAGKHYRDASLVSSPSTVLVNVFSSVPTDWDDAIFDAVNAWDNLNGGLSFTVQSGTSMIAGAINIRMSTSSDGLPNATIARASWPNSGNPGNIGTKVPLVKVNI